ncbi:MAG: hypothetical protein ACJ74J_21880 [Blastocatellia bacterium]
MRKIVFLLIMVLMLVTASVEAQKKSKQPRIQPPTPMGTYGIQDDEGEGFIVFDAGTGAFKCVMCEYGYTYSGTGTVKMDGLSCYFNCETDSYRIYLSMNAYDRQGKVVVEVYKAPNGYDVPPFTEYWEDLNMDDSPLDCAAPPSFVKPRQ